MPISITVTDVKARRAILEWDEAGQLTGLKVPVELNIGTGESFSDGTEITRGESREIDLLGQATASQRTALQALVTRLLAALRAKYL